MGSTTLSGKFLFNGTNGRLHTQKGWGTLDGKKYYTNKWGKLYTSRWIGDYYVQADGSMAVSKKISSGVYVDATGKKCTQEEFEMKNAEVSASEHDKRVQRNLVGLCEESGDRQYDQYQ